MTTAKKARQVKPVEKKRVPKDKPNPFTTRLLTDLLPFITLDPGSATLADFAGASCHLGAMVSSGGPESGKKILMAELRGNEKGALDHYRETLDAVREMIRVAVLKRQTWDSADRALYPWIQKTFEGIKFSVQWNPDELSVRPVWGGGARLDDIRLEVAWTVAHSFASGNGQLFIGMCPRCGKVFEKKQANAVFCSRYCQSEGSRK